MNVKSIAGQLGKDALAPLIRWLTIGMCLTSSPSQSRA